MPKRVLLSANELMESFQVTLADHVGGTLTAGFVRAAIESILDQYCYGRYLNTGTTEHLLLQYGVPQDVVQSAMDRLTNSLLGIIQRAFGVIHPTRSYSYQWINRGDLLIDESQYRLPAAEEASNDDNGDFIPERQRRR